jgi:NapC/NirT cytochrome c family protein
VRIRSFFASMSRDPVGLAGCALTTASALLILTLFGLELVGFHANPYVGILAYLVLPGFFVLGLALIPLGVRRQRRRAARQGQEASAFPVIDLNLDRTRNVVLTFLVLSLANIVILAVASYKGYEVMESETFCGTTCHTVMQPEHTAYGRSPHARVRCVECHIGPGANWFVRSKLSGAWQVVSVAFHLYDTPIPTPVHNLRPARETCEQCHWPSKFVGDRLKVITRHADDETNTASKTVLLLRVGGIEGRVARGIHWHVDSSNELRYRASEDRETIHEVELRNADGTTKRFRGPTADANPGDEWRVMDCVDCHNRPTHVHRQADDELDQAIERHTIDGTLPYVHREGLRLLREDHASHDEARRAIAAGLERFYAESYPELSRTRSKEIEQAGRAMGDLYAYNVFPDMKVTWGTYPNHLGHRDFPGCFRCHDDEHKSEDGSAISQDCSTCHTLLAVEEPNPEILSTLNP